MIIRDETVEDERRTAHVPPSRWRTGGAAGSSWWAVFRNKDDGAWTIPKGEAAEEEGLLERAVIEFKEELGVAVVATRPWIELGCVKQKGGKTVHAWAFESDLPESFVVVSNTFNLEWPPRSGKTQRFAEIDRAEFFPSKSQSENQCGADRFPRPTGRGSGFD